MRTIDFSPLYRSAVGFDRLAALLEAASRSEAPTGYPPYNIETVGVTSPPSALRPMVPLSHLLPQKGEVALP